MIARHLLKACLALLVVACAKEGDAEKKSLTPAGDPLPPDHPVIEDTTPKEGPRVMAAEATIRTYLGIFGGLSPIATEKALIGKDKQELFDGWSAYIDALGMPDNANDIPRLGRTNTIMIATFERIGVALCDRTVEHDATVSPRTLFDFDVSDANVDLAAFTTRFDRLHRTFLGYPAALAPEPRTKRFFDLFTSTKTGHAAATESRFTPAQAGWAAVCQGLVRHPEFHLY